MALFEHTPHKYKPRNVNQLHDDQLTFGQRVADKVASTVGSWPFIIIQSVLLALWILLNTIAFIMHWDGYPYILLNLMLSFQAAYTGPFVLMSSNRQAAKDRLTAEHDYQINMKGEEEIRQLLQHLDAQDHELLKHTDMLIDLIRHVKGKHS